MVEDIKLIRVKLDGLAALCSTFRGQNANTLQAKESLLFAKAWLGKCLAEHDVPSPYPNDGERESVADIEPTADTGRIDIDGWYDMNRVKKVDTLREILGKIVKEDYISSEELRPVSRKEAIARTNAYTHLCEARFHLGFELEWIRNQEEMNKTDE